MNPGRVLRNRNFARLFFAGAASVGGFSIGQVAINYLVFTSTHSSIDLAFTGVAFTLALVSLSLFAGTLVDRQDRRLLMIVSDGVRAASLVLVAIALIFFGFNLWLVLIASFILGAFTAVFQPAERVMITSILRKDQLSDANGLVQLTTSLAQAVSNAAGGALVVVVGSLLAIGLNSVTFLVSGLLIATIASQRLSSGEVVAKDAAPTEKKASFVADTLEGVRYLVRTRGLFTLTVSAAFLNFFFAMVIPFFVVYTTEFLHGSATTYGIFLALLALGAAPGALLVGRTGAVKRAGLVWLLTGVCEGLLLLSLILIPTVLVAYSAIFLIGLLLGFANTTWLSAVQIIVPSELQGRYFGIDQLGSVAILPVGQIIGGVTIAAFGLSWSYGIAGAGFIVVCLVFLLSPELRNLGYSSPPDDAKTSSK